jgi:hypothetical protein
VSTRRGLVEEWIICNIFVFVASSVVLLVL